MDKPCASVKPDGPPTELLMDEAEGSRRLIDAVDAFLVPKPPAPTAMEGSLGGCEGPEDDEPDLDMFIIAICVDSELVVSIGLAGGRIAGLDMGDAPLWKGC